MIVDKSDNKNSTRKLLELRNTFSKVVGYKINSQKSIALLYAKDKWSEVELRKTAPFTIASNNIKYLRVVLAEQVKDLYEKNFKTLKKTIKDGIRQ